MFLCEVAAVWNLFLLVGLMMLDICTECLLLPTLLVTAFYLGASVQCSTVPTYLCRLVNIFTVERPICYN